MKIPASLKYTQEHEWVALAEDNVATIGITAHAQDSLGEIVYVELPELGAEFSKGEEFGSVESVKAVSELFMPVDGAVIEINGELEDAPELVNEEPYNKGWMIKIKLSDASQIAGLLDSAAYAEAINGADE